MNDVNDRNPVSLRLKNKNSLAGLEPATQGLGILFQASCGTGGNLLFPFIPLFSL